MRARSGTVESEIQPRDAVRGNSEMRMDVALTRLFIILRFDVPHYDRLHNSFFI